ncbi:MAG: 4'-phosphopantetheinyl transferase superfamily protein [Pseudomonadaceae bacterium]|nr:4'-phosphopantetheinyl transferase superfamily protein [Pseudomonadaceae bacterium]
MRDKLPNGRPSPSLTTTLVGFTDPAIIGLKRLEWPEPAQSELVFAPVADHCAQLTARELVAVSKSVASRRAEFSTGRLCAHLACERLGVPVADLVADEQRRPQWPQALAGAISHTDELAAALVAPSAVYAGVGIDIEGLGRVSADLVPRLLTREERTIDGLDPAIVFSAKEAVYKAINPLAGAFIGFQEVQGRFDLAAKTFSMRYTGEHEASERLESGRGYWREWRGWVISVFVIDS